MRQLALSTPTSKKNPFADLTDTTAMELLSGMLTLNPTERWNMDRVINHPYFANYKRAEPPLKVSVSFSCPETKCKKDIWDILIVAFQDFQLKHSLVDAEVNRMVSIPARFQHITI